MEHNCVKSFKFAKNFKFYNSELWLPNKLMCQCGGNYRIVGLKDSHRLRQLCARKITPWKKNNSRKIKFTLFDDEGRSNNDDCYDDDND